jgi:hypothetical protein
LIGDLPVALDERIQMRNLYRPAILISAAIAVATIGTPAFATASTTKVPTSLNARAHKTVEAPRHQDAVHLTLRSRHTGVAGEADNFLVRTRRDNTTAKWSAWQPVSATPGDVNGRYRVSVTMPAKIAQGKKEQYQVKFAGDEAKGLASSRSQVITVTAS